jgi:hypothetical protein
MRCFIASALPLKLKYQGFTLPKYISRVGVRNAHKPKSESTTKRGGGMMMAVVRIRRMV